jgi:hypothetical protein
MNIVSLSGDQRQAGILPLCLVRGFVLRRECMDRHSGLRIILHKLPRVAPTI